MLCPTTTLQVPADGVLDLNGEIVNGQRLPKPKWDTAQTPPRWNGAWNLIDATGTGDVVVRNGSVMDYESGGSAIKGQALSNSMTVERMKFLGVGSYPFATPHPKGAGPWAPGIVAYTKRLTVMESDFIGCGLGSKFGECLYPRADYTLIEHCKFLGCGTVIQSPNLVTPDSIPRLVLKYTVFDGAEFWNDDRGGWMGALMYVNPKSIVTAENCTFTGKWRHIFNYLDPTRYVGRGNRFEKLSFEDNAIAFGGKYTLQQWVAMAEIDAVVV